MFNAGFYPTPRSVSELMGLDVTGKIVLEPSAGKGDLVDYLKDIGASRILVCEIEEDLRAILQTKDCEFVGQDFLDVQSSDISHVDMIVMNPPFANAHEHIQHAFDIAPEGCEIISLCNWETISKDYHYSKLSSLIRNYGLTVNLGEVFTDAERKTNVTVGLIKLYVPVVSEDFDYESMFFMEPDEEETRIGLAENNSVRRLVQSHVGAMKVFDKLLVLQKEMKYTTSSLDFSGIRFSVSYGHNNEVTTRQQFSKHMQKVAWSKAIDMLNMRKYVTRGMIDKINKFVETQTNVPFTMKNVYVMIEMIMMTRQETLKQALVESVDHFTRYTDKNRWGVAGWKTNSGHMLNQKFIVDYLVEVNWNGTSLDFCYRGKQDYIDDLLKVMCNLTGSNYDNMITLRKLKEREGTIYPGEWYDFNFWEAKFYKKGTGHFRFKNKDQWIMLNRAYAAEKDFVLPESVV